MKPRLHASRRPLGALLALLALPLVSRLAQDEGWTQAELEQLTSEVQAQITAIRGEEFLRPVEVRVANREDFIAYMKMRLEKTETPEKLAADETIVKLLGLVPPEMDVLAETYQLLESQVGGFYDPDSDSFSLMDQCPKGLGAMILSHELGHALDDQLFGIDQGLAKVQHDADRTLAYHALVEGSGTAVMNQWFMKHPDQVDMNGAMAFQLEAQAAMVEAPMVMWKPLLGAYMAGASFLARTDNMMAGQTAVVPAQDIRAGFERPPVSTEQVLHPEKYWDAEQRDEPVAVSFVTAQLPPGWSDLRQDTMGELMTAIVTTPKREREDFDGSNPMAMLSLKFTNDAAAGWGGDRYILLGHEGGGRVLRWVTRWDSERDAGEFYMAMRAALPDLDAAADALRGDLKYSSADVEYGERRDEVLVTLRYGVKNGDLKRVLRSLTHGFGS